MTISMSDMKRESSAKPRSPRSLAKHLAGALGIGALVVLSGTALSGAAIHDGITVASLQAKGGGSPTGNATAPVKPPQMLLGQTAGEEPTTTTTIASR